MCDHRGMNNKIEAIYQNKNGDTLSFCEECMSKIDFSNIDTYQWFFEILDTPYCQDMIDNTIQYYKRYRPEKQRTPERILCNYLAKMKLAGFKPFGFNDSIRFDKGE